MKIKIYNCQTNEELQEFDLASAIRTTGKCIVGRSTTSGLILESSDVSRNHGEFLYKGRQYYFADIGSSNGSLVNNEIAIKNQTYLLKAGDVIQLGDFLLIPQPTTGVFEEATVIAPIASQFPSLQESSFSEVSVGAEPVAIATPPEFVANSELQAESQVATPASDERDEPRSEESMPPETEHSEAVVANSELQAESQVATPASDERDEPRSEESMPPETEHSESVAAKSELQAESQVAMPASDERDEPRSEESMPPEAEHSESVAAKSELQAESQVAMPASDEWDEHISAVVTEASFEESVPLEVDEQYISEEFPAAVAAELTLPKEPHFDGVLSHEAVEQIETAIAQEANLPQETISPEVVEEITEKLADDGTSLEEPSAEISTVGAEEANISEESMPLETFALGITEEFPEPMVLEISTSTEEVQAAPVAEEETYVQIHLHELTAVETTDAIISPIDEADIEVAEVTDEELSDRDDGSAIPEIFKEKYIALLAHESQKAELVDFIERHQKVFSKCQLMATLPISEALMQQSDIAVSRKLSNLTAGGYQEVNFAIASKELLAVIFLRDFFVPQTTQANDEALTRACNVNQVIFAGNVATAQALEGYLQHLIASTPKAYHS
jgi:methylglyoxal synthase/pSer/pThr/pTyr-binding forkhead associated (FHA) protein